MGKRDLRIDAHIREAAPFARPALSHLRRIVHDAAPGIEETIKWRVPHFVQGGIGQAGRRGEVAMTRRLISPGSTLEAGNPAPGRGGLRTLRCRGFVASPRSEILPVPLSPSAPCPARLPP